MTLFHPKNTKSNPSLLSSCKMQTPAVFGSHSRDNMREDGYEHYMPPKYLLQQQFRERKHGRQPILFYSSFAWTFFLPSFSINQQTSSWSIFLMFSFSYFLNISLSISYCYLMNFLEQSNIFSKFPCDVFKALKALMILIH